MQGGGTGAFASVALNLMHRGEKADYILTGDFYFHRFVYLFNITDYIRQAYGRQKQLKRHLNT